MGVIALTMAAVAALGGYAGSRGDARPDALRSLAQTQANQALAQAGFGWARLAIDGSVGQLQGDAPDEPARAALERQARDLLSPWMGLPGVFLGLDNRVRMRPRQRMAALAGTGFDPSVSLPPTGAGRPTRAATEAPLRGAACEAAFQGALGGEEIHFRAASTQLEPPARLLVKRLGTVASRCPGWRLVVEGHADARGDAAVNERLARRRASSVAAELLLQGAAVEQLETVGLIDEVRAAASAAAPDAAAAAAAAGRRVSFRFIQAEAD
jgi:outer membrane protein OmpA-like peptidoglycan-associated protein